MASLWLLSGQILQNGTCIAVSQCPCVYHGTAYPLGHVLEQGCSVWLETSNFHSFTPKTLNKKHASPISNQLMITVADNRKPGFLSNVLNS